MEEKLSYANYKKLIDEHTNIYDRKYRKTYTLKYDKYYWVDTPRSWRGLPQFQKEQIIEALEEKIKKESL